MTSPQEKKGLLLYLIFLATSLFAPYESAAAPKINELESLIKITVGPYDNYEGEMQNENLIFTRKINLAPHLFSHSFLTGKSTPLIELSEDAKEPQVEASQKRVLYTSYRTDARGRICILYLGETKDKRCLPQSKNEVFSPFWVNSVKIGFLSRENVNRKVQLILYDLINLTQTVLDTGDISTPSAHDQNQLLIWSQNFKEKRILILYNLNTQIKKEIEWDLPGFSSSARFSKDGRFIYFSHYLNDTNGDQLIDAGDHSVIFRMPLSKIEDQKKELPEQLTSLEMDCRYPRPEKDFLLVSCDFGETLDIYRLPLSGLVPAHWDEKLILNAHQSSRSYENRLLLLNSLRHRGYVKDERSVLLKILSNHLFNNELTAAYYYNEQLIQRNDLKKDNTILKILKKYIYAKQVFYRFQQGDPHLFQIYNQLLAEIKKYKNYDVMKAIVTAHIYSLMGDPYKAYSHLPPLSKTLNSLEIYLYLSLASKIFPILNKTQKMIELLSVLIDSPDLSHETRIYYTFHLLELLRIEYSDTNKRAHLINSLIIKTPEAIRLINSEKLILQINLAEENEKKKYFNDLSKGFVESRSDYYLRKALYIRAIVNFIMNDDYQNAQNVAANWLRFTQFEDTEMKFAKEQYTESELDQAYDKYLQGNLLSASGHFYGAISLADDLEAHYGYIISNLKLQKEKELIQTYNNLKDRKVINENFLYFEALIDLTSKSYDLDKSISRLETMKSNSPMLHLLLGYCYMDRIFKNNEKKANQKDLDQAHSHLLLAYDLAKDNHRIKSSTLFNLGLLHQKAQNYSFSVKFFSERKKLDFENQNEHESFSWFYARSLYYINEPLKAAEELRQNLPQSGPLKLVWLDRLGFYYQAAEKYDLSFDYYTKFFKEVSFDQSDMTTDFSLAYTMMKLGKIQEAKKIFYQVLDKLKVDTGKYSKRIKQRIHLYTLGFLAQLEDLPQAIKYRIEREKLFINIKDELELLFIEKSNWYDYRIRNKILLSLLYFQNGEDKNMILSLEEALGISDELIRANDHFLSRANYETLFAFYRIGFIYPELLTGQQIAQKHYNGIEANYLKMLKKNEDLILTERLFLLEVLKKAYDFKKDINQNGQNLMREYKQHFLQSKKFMDFTQKAPKHAERVIALLDQLTMKY